MGQKRIEEYTLEGKNFIYIDLSGLKSNREFTEFMGMMQPVLVKYPIQSLYTITNIENVRIDTESKGLIAEYIRLNRPYVKHAAVIGIDGIKKLMINTVTQFSAEYSILYAFSKEQATQLLLKKK